MSLDATRLDVRVVLLLLSRYSPPGVEPDPAPLLLVSAPGGDGPGALDVGGAVVAGRGSSGGGML